MPTRTNSSNQLSLPNQLVILAQLVPLDSQIQKPLCDLHLRLCRLGIFESTDERNTNAPIVVAQSMRALDVPTAALVDVAVVAHQEVVDDVVPTSSLDVKCLHLAQPQLALGFRVTGPRGCVADYHMCRR